eukprot:1813940-Rhodomonas_salina.1
MLKCLCPPPNPNFDLSRSGVAAAGSKCTTLPGGCDTPIRSHLGLAGGTHGGTTAEMTMGRGLQQGDALSPVLFL